MPASCYGLPMQSSCAYWGRWRNFFSTDDKKVFYERRKVKMFGFRKSRKQGNNYRLFVKQSRPSLSLGILRILTINVFSLAVLCCSAYAANIDATVMQLYRHRCRLRYLQTARFSPRPMLLFITMAVLLLWYHQSMSRRKMDGRLHQRMRAFPHR